MHIAVYIAQMDDRTSANEMKSIVMSGYCSNVKCQMSNGHQWMICCQLSRFRWLILKLTPECIQKSIKNHHHIANQTQTVWQCQQFSTRQIQCFVSKDIQIIEFVRFQSADHSIFCRIVIRLMKTECIVYTKYTSWEMYHVFVCSMSIIRQINPTAKWCHIKSALHIMSMASDGCALDGFDLICSNIFYFIELLNWIEKFFP